MLDVGKDIVSHFKHSDLSTDALLEQQREIYATMKPRKLIQTSWKDKHQQMYWVGVVYWSRTSSLLHSLTYVIWRYWVWLQVLLAWSDEVQVE